MSGSRTADGRFRLSLPPRSPLWSALTRAQRQVLGKVAEGESQLLSAASLESMGLGKSTAQQARDTLIAEGIIRSDRQILATVDPFLARWLQS